MKNIIAGGKNFDTEDDLADNSKAEKIHVGSETVLKAEIEEDILPQTEKEENSKESYYVSLLTDVLENLYFYKDMFYDFVRYGLGEVVGK